MDRAVQLSGGLALKEITTVTPTVLGDKFLNDGHTMLQITNGANATVVTVVGVPCSHGRTQNTVFNTLANKSYLLGPFAKDLFNDADGKVTVTVDQNAATTVAYIQSNID